MATQLAEHGPGISINSVAQQRAQMQSIIDTVLLVVLGPYPVAMVGVDTATVNNTYPTRVTMLLLGMFQAGMVVALEPWGRRLAARAGVVTAVVGVSGAVAVGGIALAIGAVLIAALIALQGRRERTA